MLQVYKKQQGQASHLPPYASTTTSFLERPFLLLPFLGLLPFSEPLSLLPFWVLPFL
jgi:hypothetical protein